MTCPVLLQRQVNTGTNVVLQNNIVAGYERVGYRINGEPCPGSGHLFNHLSAVIVDLIHHWVNHRS